MPPTTAIPTAAPPSAPPDGKDVVLHTRVVTDTGGGPDKTILLSASYLADSRYWLAAAYMHPPDDPGYDAVRQRAAQYGCPLLSVPDRGPLDRSVLRGMLDICKQFRVKIWHGHDYKSNLLGLTLRPFYNMKLVSTLHGWVKNTNRTPLYYRIDRWCLPYYHHVIGVSEDLVESARKLGIPESRLSLIENGVDERMFARTMPAAESPLRKEFGTPRGRLVIGAVGRLSAEKAFNHLIQAVHELVKAGRDVELWIAGEGDARGDLEKLVAQMGMGDRVRLLGFRSDTVALYQALDVFALSSLREGLPNVVLEAMSMRVPVISTRVAGVPRLIADGSNGLLVPIGDPAALAAALRRVVDDVALRNALADEARSTIEKRYSFTLRMAREKDVYDKVMAVTAGASS